MAQSGESRVIDKEEALSLLRTGAEDDSMDEDDDMVERLNMQTINQSDSDNSDSSGEEFSEGSSSNAAAVSGGSILPSRAGVQWTNITGQERRGRTAAENVFRQKCGPTSYAVEGIEAGRPLTAFRLFLDEPMLRTIRGFTELHGKRSDANFTVSLTELECFIGLQLARGVLAAKNTPVSHLWNAEWGPPIFRNSMPRQRFTDLMKHLRFDNIASRQTRREGNKFCLISEIWDSFIENCRRCYIPNFDLTIDEQLFPCKSRCSFTQYMASKPDKFGIKFWLLVDAKSKYLCNGKPYLGKDPLRSPENSLPTDVCLWLVTPFLNKGYNITTDNFFTSLDLAEKLKAKKTTIVGTIRKQRREIPNVDQLMKSKAIFESKILKSITETTLTVYKVKRSKIVCLLSTMHKTVTVDMEHRKKLPDSVAYYNTSKAGVDILDQMARYHTCKSGTRRWPVAVFFNILDLACINSYIIYKELTKSSLSRRQFLLELIKELCAASVACEPQQERAPANLQAPLACENPNRKRRQCQIEDCRNKSQFQCITCTKVCCGKHTSSKVTYVTCCNCSHKHHF